MKNLSEFSMKEVRQLVITIKAELKNISSDDDLKAVLTAFADAKNGKKTDVILLDAIYAIIDSLLVTNERALWVILAAITQSTVAEVQEMNNVECLEVAVGFFSIPIYKELLSQALKSDTTAPFASSLT